MRHQVESMKHLFQRTPVLIVAFLVVTLVVAPQIARVESAGESLAITLASNPIKLSSGNAKVRIEVKDPSGAPVSDAKVEMRAEMPGMTVPNVAARPAKEAGVYEATLKLGMAGAWTVEVIAARPQGGNASAKFNLEAK